MARGINVLLTLIDKFSEPMKKAAGETKKATRQIRNAQNMVNKFAGDANQKFLSLAGSVAKIGLGIAAVGAGLAVAGIKSFADEAIEKANAQVAAETKLVTILGDVKAIQEQGAGAAERAAKALGAYASQLQTVGLAGMAQLGTFQMTEDQIKTVSAGMLDLLVNQKGLNATQEDAVNVANMIGKVMMGNVGALQRVGISLDDYQKNIIKTGTADERAAMIAEVLAQNVGGVNEAMRKTDAGQAAAIMNDYGDMQEEVGKRLNKVRTGIMTAFAGLITPLGNALAPIMDQLVAKVDAALPSIQAFATNLAAALPGIIESVGNGISFLVQHFQDFIAIAKTIGPVIAGIATGFAAFNVINGVISKIQMLRTLFTGIQLAGGVAQFAVLLNPIGLLAAAIGILAVAFYTLYTQSEPFRESVNELASQLMALGELVMGILAPRFEAAWIIISSAVESAVDVIGGVLANVVGVLADLIGFIVNVFTGNWEAAWQNVVDIFQGIFDTLASIAAAPLNFIMGMVDNISSKISSIHLPSLPFGGGGDGGGDNPDTNALGTTYFRGGQTMVNENGGELITLPSGSQIMPHKELLQLINNGGRGDRVTVNISVQGNVIGNQEYMRQTGEYIVARIRDALRNS